MPPVLRPYVASMVAYDVDFGAPGTHRGMPGTGVTFVLPVDEPIEVSWADGSQRRALWSSVSGLHPQPAAIHHNGTQRGVQLELTPLGVRALFGMPAAAWSGDLLSLEEVCGDEDLGHLPEMLATAEPPHWERIVTSRLLQALTTQDVPGVRAEVGRALALLTRGVDVRSTAADVGYSRRRLSDLVRAEVGVTPKQYQRIARFERARRLVGRVPLAQAAGACGYADQAHLTREWRELAGCTPTTWVREEFPFVQDDMDRMAAGSWA